MENIRVTTSKKFKQKTIKAILSVLLFIIVYLSLVILVLAFSAILLFWGIVMIFTHFSYITLLLGGGIILTAILLIVFIFKFIFATQTDNLSDLIEISPSSEPKLFALIIELSKTTQVTMPKRIFLSHQVNASVFFSSSFWSLLFPVRKNLVIGLGLMNCTTEEELKSIIAHEFGHFAQSSMHVGSYVYYSNRIIQNILTEDSGYDFFAQSISDINRVLPLFVKLAKKFTKLIQWVLGKVAIIIRKNELAMAREMEFYADQVAAITVGADIFSSALLHLQYGFNAMQVVTNNYLSYENDHIITKDIFSQQSLIMEMFADRYSLELKNSLPIITLENKYQFTDSKIEIISQWSSHPTTSQRINAISNLDIKNPKDNSALSIGLISDIEKYNQTLTYAIFPNFRIAYNTVYLTTKEFEEKYKTEFSSPYHDLFNKYYDTREPVFFDSTELKPAYSDISKCFSSEKKNLNMEFNQLENDITFLEEISKNKDIREIEYDSAIYESIGFEKLLLELRKKQEILKIEIEENDRNIEHYFNTKASFNGLINKFNSLKNDYQSIKDQINQLNPLMVRIHEAVNFMTIKMKFEIIRQNIENLRPIEDEFKSVINEIRNNQLFKNQITTEMNACFDKYISVELKYFINNCYQNDEVNLLSSNLENFRLLILNTITSKKQELLNIMVMIETGN